MTTPGRGTTQMKEAQHAGVATVGASNKWTARLLRQQRRAFVDLWSDQT